MGKYVTFDWFMKKLLRNKGNSVVLEWFLSVLFGTQIIFKRKNVWDIFPEYFLLRVNKFDEEVKEPLQEWISFLKTGEIPKSYTAQGLAEAREVMRVSELDEEERKAYERYIDSIRISRSVAFSYDDMGYCRGLEEGEKKGRVAALLATARSMRADGLSVDVIAKYTGLTPGEITEL